MGRPAADIWVYCSTIRSLTEIDRFMQEQSFSLAAIDKMLDGLVRQKGLVKTHKGDEEAYVQGSISSDQATDVRNGG